MSGSVCGCVVGFCCRGSSVLVFFGEQVVRVVVCGRYFVSSDAGLLVGSVGGSVGMFLWTGIVRRVQGGLVGLVVSGPSV